MNKPMSRQRNIFILGWVWALASYSIVQDLLGRDEYIREAHNGWLPAWFTISAALAAMLWMTFVMRRDRRRYQRVVQNAFLNPN